MNSYDLKAAVFSYAMRAWRPKLVVDEFSLLHGISDVVVLKMDNMLLDIEIKTSLSDLKADVKKTKWCKLLDNSCEYRSSKNWRYDWIIIPNYFYVVIPESIQEKALEFINMTWPFAGVLTTSEYQHFLSTNGPLIYDLKNIKRVNKIHNNPVSEKGIMRLQENLTRKYLYRASEFFSLKGDKDGQRTETG